MDALKQLGQILAVIAILGALAGIAVGAFVVTGITIGVFSIGFILYVIIQELFTKD